MSRWRPCSKKRHARITATVDLRREIKDHSAISMSSAPRGQWRGQPPKSGRD